MRGDEFAVPAQGVQLDAFGNVRRSLIVRIVQQMGRVRRGGYRYFVPAPGSRLPRGVWEQQGKRVRPLMLFVTDRPDYRRRYPFGQATLAEAERIFAPAWHRYWLLELAKHQTQGS